MMDDELTRLRKSISKLDALLGPGIGGNVIKMVHAKHLKLAFSPEYPNGALFTKEAWDVRPNTFKPYYVADVDAGLAGALNELVGVEGVLTKEDMNET